MIDRRSVSLFSLAVSAALATACTDGTRREDDFDREAMLVATTDGVIVPSYEALVASTGAFRTSVDALCAEPDAARLAAARAAWRDMRRDWKRTEAFRFGPVEELQARAALDTWPTAFVFVENTLSGSGTLDAAAVAALPVSQRGQPAAEYILWGRDTDDATLLAGLGTAGAPTRRCQYLQGVAADLGTVVQSVLDAWRTTYRAEFTGAGANSTTYPTLKSAVDQMVNQLVATSESIAGARLADPMGLRTGGTPVPGKVESPYADNGLADMENIRQGIESLYLGTLPGGVAGLSLADHVQGRSAELHTQVMEELDTLETALAAIPPPLASALTAQPTLTESAYQHARDLKRVFATSVVATLGVTLTFNDNDGD